MNPQELRRKAEIAMASARILLEAGDPDGACSHAYYAMFDAARAALIMSGAQTESEIPKTHSGLIAAFSLHLVKTNKLSVDLGKSLNRIHQIRLIADYKGDAVEIEIAKKALLDADSFVRTVFSALK